jgi:hypothetical protein
MVQNKLALAPPSGKEKLSVLRGVKGKDLSCHEFTGKSIAGQNFLESIFNGCVFANIQVSKSIFRHAEFTETSFSDCNFKDTSFDHSDFVLTVIQRCRFVRCSFENAEWRDTIFENVSFQECVFRNTTTSLTEFINCSFDSNSSLSFVGSSKRFSLFSGCQFYLSTTQTEFLRTNFGIVALGPGNSPPIKMDDPLYEMSLARYNGKLTSAQFCQLLLTALSKLTKDDTQPHRLRLQYISGICKILLRDNFLSIFSMEIMEKEFSERTRFIQNRDQALQLFSLILTLRITLRERIFVVESELALLPPIVPHQFNMHMECCRTFELKSIEEYLRLMADYCGVPATGVSIKGFRQGSTIVDFIVSTPTSLVSVLRFLKYSLSMVTITLNETNKLRKACAALQPKSRQRESIATDRISGKAKLTRNKERPAESIANEIMGSRPVESRSMEIFVDKAKDKVLIIDGKVRITIILN